MKKTIKILLTVLYVVIASITICKSNYNFLSDRLIFAGFSFPLFCFHLFAWIAPNTCFNLCWKLASVLLEETYDYETSYGHIENMDIGIAFFANIWLGLSLLI